MDANTGRALVKMAVGNNEVEMSELFLKPVSIKEYRDSARVLSKKDDTLYVNNPHILNWKIILDKEKYDEYKTKQEKERKEKEKRDEDGSRRKKRRHSRTPGKSFLLLGSILLTKIRDKK